MKPPQAHSYEKKARMNHAAKLRMRRNYEKKKEEVKARVREYYWRMKDDPNWRENYTIRKRLTARDWRELNLEKARARERAKAKNSNYKPDPIKTKARVMVKNYLKRGAIKKPSCCEVCSDSKSRIEAHHHDYSKPLDVKWLCSKCHGKEHRKPIAAIRAQGKK